MDSKQYQELLSRAKLLMAKSSTDQWELGDIILMMCPMRDTPKGRKKRLPGEETVTEQLGKIRQELGDIKISRLMILRRVSYVFPPKDRRKTSWTVHAILQHKPDRVQDGMTTGEAKAAASRRKDKFTYTCQLLDSAARFIEAGSRYAEKRSLSPQRTEIMWEHISRVDVALDGLLNARDWELERAAEPLAA